MWEADIASSSLQGCPGTGVASEVPVAAPQRSELGPVGEAQGQVSAQREAAQSVSQSLPCSNLALAAEQGRGKSGAVSTTLGGVRAGA